MNPRAGGSAPVRCSARFLQKGLGRRVPLPRLAGRLSTLLQFLLIFSILFPPHWFGGFAAARPPLIYLCAAALAVSLVDYARQFLSRRSQPS